MLFRAVCSSVLILAGVFLANPLKAQSTPTAGTASQAATLLQKSLAAQTGGQATTDTTLSGTVTFLMGSNTESGTLTLTALDTGATEAAFVMPTRSDTEIWSDAKGVATVTGTGSYGTVTEPAGESLGMPYPAWFSPSLLTALVSGSGYASSYAGPETRNGASVDHVVVWQAPAQGSSAPAAPLADGRRGDIYLDPSTFLPVSAVFQVWPYHPPGKPLSIRATPVPEEVRYSDYQSVDGRAVPLHIQVFLPGKQILDVLISSVEFNTGATITTPN